MLAARSFSIALLPALPPRTPPPPPPPSPPAAAPEVPEREATPAPFGREGSDASLFADTLVEGLLERPGPLLPRTTPRRLSAGRRSWEVRAAALLSVYGVPCIVGHTSRQTAWQLASTAGMWGRGGCFGELAWVRTAPWGLAAGHHSWLACAEAGRLHTNMCTPEACSRLGAAAAGAALRHMLLAAGC